jgi:hypothetical protein
VLTILISVSLLGYLGWRSVATYTQFRRFQQVDKSITELEVKLKLEFGSSISYSSRKSCDRASTEFGGGRLSCTRGITYFIPNNSLEIDNFEVRFLEMLSSDFTLLQKDKTGLYSPFLENGETNNDYFENKSGMNCYMSARKIDQFYIGIDCTELSLWKYFTNARSIR